MRLVLYLLLTQVLAQVPEEGIPVEESPVIDTGTVYIPADSVHRGNLGVTGDAVIEGTIKGDLVVAEGSLDMSGTVEGDVVLLGGKFNIQGSVEREFVIFGSEGEVSGRIEYDVLLLGGTLTLDSLSVVDGNILSVGGNIRTHDAAQVTGDIQQVDPGPFLKWIQGVASRRLVRQKGVNLEGGPRLSSRTINGIQSLIAFAFVYLLGLASMAIFTRWHRRSELLVKDSPWKMILTGIIVRLAVSGILAILVISVIGWVLVPVGLLLWAFVAFMGIPQTTLWMGNNARKWFKIKKISRFWKYTLGFVVLYAVSIIGAIVVMFGPATNLPARILRVSGFLIVYACMTLGRGSIFYALLFRKEAKTLEQEADENP